MPEADSLAPKKCHLIAHAWPADPAERTRAAAWLRDFQPLQAMLKASRTTPVPQAEDALNTPFEHAWAAHALPGLVLQDGCLPLAALLHPEDPAAQAWISFCHLDVGVEGARLAKLELLSFSEQQIEQILGQWSDLASEDGLKMLDKHPSQPLTWRVSATWLADIRAASWQRVAAPGARVDEWLGPLANDAIKQLRRLQNEFQMLMYTHAINDEREARGELAVNSFWLWGAGAVPEGASVQHCTVDERFSLAENRGLAAWQAAWQALAAELPARLKSGETLLICGEKGYLSAAAAPTAGLEGLKHRISRLFNPLSRDLLHSLL